MGSKGYDLGFTAADLVVRIGDTRDGFQMEKSDYPTWSWSDFRKEKNQAERKTSYISHSLGEYVKNEQGGMVPADANDRLRAADDRQSQLWYTYLNEKNSDEVREAAKVLSEAIRKAMLAVMKEALEIAFPDYKLRYNRYAGCSCGCSQGFQMRSRKTRLMDKGKITWATITCPTKA